MRLIFVLAVFALSLALLAGFFGALHPALDSFAHFRAHLAIMALFAALGLASTGAPRVGLAVLALAAGALSTTASVFLPARAQTDGAMLTALHLNLRFDNTAPEAALQLFTEASPDVLLLSEVAESWRSRLDRLADWPHRHHCAARGRVGGGAILSRLPFAGSPACHADGALSVATVATKSGAAVTLAEAHLKWPWPSRQNQQIAALADAFAALPAASLLAGDFNATPWSAAVARIASAGKLAVVPGVGPTWSPFLHRFLRPVGLPIDNVLAGQGVGAVEIRTVAVAGTDHSALIMRIGGGAGN